MTGSPTAIHVWKINNNNLHRFVSHPKTIHTITEIDYKINIGIHGQAMVESVNNNPLEIRTDAYNIFNINMNP